MICLLTEHHLMPKNQRFRREKDLESVEFYSQMTRTFKNERTVHRAKHFENSQYLFTDVYKLRDVKEIFEVQKYCKRLTLLLVCFYEVV